MGTRRHPVAHRSPARRGFAHRTPVEPQAPGRNPGESDYDYSVRLAGYYFGDSANSEDQQFIAEELSAQQSRRGSSPVDVGRAWDPNRPFAGIGKGALAGIGARDMQELLSVAENWSALVGWKEYPTASELLQLYQSGQYTDPESAYQWLTDRSPTLKNQFPWAQFGMNKSTYEAQKSHQTTLFEQLTGGTSFAESDLYWAVRQGWTEADWIRQLQDRPGMGYLKHGFNYNTWQEYKQQNRNAVVARYGEREASSTDIYLKNLENPLPSFSASGTGSKVSDTLSLQQQSGSEVR